MLTRVLLAVSAAVLGFGIAAPSAAVGKNDGLVMVGGEQGSGTKDVTLRPSDPGSGGGSAAGGSDSTGGTTRTEGRSTCTYLGDTVPCTSPAGVWNGERGCYVKRVSPQPPFDYPGWGGRTEGSIYMCYSPSGGGMDDYEFWAPSAGGAGAPVLVDPVTLAEEAIERMNLVGARVGATPLIPGAPGVVGIQTWLWVDNAGERAWGPATRSASAGSVTVTATAKATKVVWDMGDGTTVTCANKGTEWTRARGDGDSPTCGHTYQVDSGGQPGDAYTITATTHWRVEWTGAGQSGVITFTLTGPGRAMPVVELQALRTT